MTPSRNTLSISMKYKDSMDILPATPPASPSLPKSDFDHLKTTNDRIQNALIDTTNKHQSDTKTINDNISDMIQNLTAENSKTDKHKEKITEISSGLIQHEVTTITYEHPSSKYHFERKFQDNIFHLIKVLKTRRRTDRFQGITT